MILFNTLFTALLAGTALAAPTKAPFTKRSNSKKGVAYNDATLVHLFSDAAWAYDWDKTVDGALPNGIEYIPMLHDAKSMDGWEDAVNTALASGSTHLLGFNEPDIADQANMLASEASTKYKEKITKYSGKAKLVSPAVSNGVASAGQTPKGLDWMKQFLDDCNGGCGISVMAIHYYADDNVSNFKNHVNKAIALAAKYGISDVWITEFQATGVSDDAQAAFIKAVVPWLDAQSAIKRYAYFWAADGYMTSGSALSKIGSAYNGA